MLKCLYISNVRKLQSLASNNDLMNTVGLMRISLDIISNISFLGKGGSNLWIKTSKKNPISIDIKISVIIANFDRIVTYSVPIVHYFKRVFFFWYWRSVPFSSYYEKLLSKDQYAFSLRQDVELSRDLNKPNRRYYFKPGFVFLFFLENYGRGPW